MSVSAHGITWLPPEETFMDLIAMNYIKPIEKIQA